MSRPIKFRAWDLKNKKFLSPDDIDVNISLGWGMTKNAFEIKVKGLMGFPEETLLMQFTGRHDKNGKEIFEGDIVQAFGQPETRGTVEWLSWGFTLKHFKSPDFSRPIEVEVLGNIYENPELLK